MLSPAPERSSRNATTLATRPPVATISIAPAGTSGGSVKRPTASITTYTATPVSSTRVAQRGEHLEPVEPEGALRVGGRPAGRV